MTNMIIAFQKLHYNIEYIGVGIFLVFLLILRLIIASKSKATKVVKTAKRKLEEKVE